MTEFKYMDKEKLKLIVRNLELLVDGLKAEVYSDVNVCSENLAATSQYMGSITDYDEIYDEGDDDEYSD
jgi:hypothetical protein